MKKTALLILIGLLISSPVFAKIGVGVGLGKIQIDEPLKSGGIYNLPNLPVLNTGDEAGEYEMEVTFQQDQPQLKPEASWFSFSPSTFNLDAGQSQIVEVRLTVPASVTSGDYFAYLEAHPVQKAEGVTIGIAAATKTYFTIKAGTVLGVIVLIILIIIFRKYFALRFKIERKNK